MSDVVNGAEGGHGLTSSPNRTIGQGASPSATSAGTTSSTAVATTVTPATTKKKFGKNLNKLVKKPTAVTTTQTSTGSGIVSSSSFIAKKNEGASSTGGGLLLLSTKRSSSTASAINSVGSSASGKLSGASSSAVASKQVPVTTAASVAATGSTSSALLAKLSGGMALSAKGAAAHKAATATLTSNTTSSTTSSSSYPKAAGPRPLNTPSLKSLVGASSVGDAATSGPTGTAGWKKTPVPPVAPSSMFGSDDKKREDEKNASEDADASGTSARTSKVWKLGNAHADAASLLLPSGPPKKESSSGRMHSSSFGSRGAATRHSISNESSRKHRTGMPDQKDTSNSFSSSRLSLLERSKAAEDSSSTVGDGSGGSALSRIAAIREARRRQSSNAPKEEATSTMSAQQLSAQAMPGSGGSSSAMANSEVVEGAVSSLEKKDDYNSSPKSKTFDEQPPAVILKKDPQSFEEGPKRPSTEILPATTTIKKPQISLELLNNKPSGRKSNLSESSLTPLGTGDDTLLGKGSSSREESANGLGLRNNMGPEAPGRTYSSLLGGSSKVKVEQESGDTVSRSKDSSLMEEKRLGPPMRIIKRRLYNPSDEKGRNTAANGTSKGQRDLHSQGPSSNRRGSGDAELSSGGNLSRKVDGSLTTGDTGIMSNRDSSSFSSKEAGPQFDKVSAKLSSRESATQSNRDSVNVGSPNVATIHLSSYDDKNRGESSTTSPRMLFDPKSGSMVEANQQSMQPHAIDTAAKGSKANRGGIKRNKGTGRDNERERDSGRENERDGGRERGQGSRTGDDRVSSNSKWNTSKSEPKGRDGVTGRNRRGGGGRTSSGSRDEAPLMERNAPTSTSSNIKSHINSRTKSNRSKQSDSGAVESTDAEKQRSPALRKGNNTSNNPKAQVSSSPSKQHKPHPRAAGGSGGGDLRRHREDRESLEDVEGDKRREGKGGRNLFGQSPNQADSTSSNRSSRASSREIGKNRVSRGPLAKGGSAEIRNSRARALRGQTGSGNASYSQRDGGAGAASSGRRPPGGGRPHGAGRDNGRGSPNEFSNGGFNNNRRSPQFQSSGAYSTYNARHGHQHNTRSIDDTANTNREKQQGPQALDPSPPIVFDSGGVSLPEVAPQFNDDDFKVITDITDSIPSDLTSNSNITDRANALNAGSSTTIGTNAWHSSEATLAFAAVAAAHTTQTKPEQKEYNRGNTDDGDDDTDDLLNVPFLGGLGFDPTSDMDAVISSPTRQGHDGDDHVSSTLESLTLGAGVNGKSNPFATLGNPASQFLGSSAWGGGRTLHEVMSNSSNSKGTSEDHGVNKNRSGLNLNWNSILSGGAERAAVNEGQSPNRSNGWVASTIGRSALEPDVGMQAGNSKK